MVLCALEAILLSWCYEPYRIIFFNGPLFVIIPVVVSLYLVIVTTRLNINCCSVHFRPGIIIVALDARHKIQGLSQTLTAYCSGDPWWPGACSLTNQKHVEHNLDHTLGHL